MTNPDVVVIGAGMVGAAAAVRMAQQGLQVAVVEPRLPETVCDDAFIDLRVSAISPASRALLVSLGAWSQIGDHFLSPYRAMRVWDAQVPPFSAEALSFEAAEIGASCLGHIVENRRIVAALHRVMSEMETLALYSPAQAHQLALGVDKATVTLDDGRELTARLVVGADGADSAIREQAGIGTRGWSYQQSGVVTHVQTEKPHQETAWQRFLPSGPIALLPLYDGRCSVVWSTSNEEAARLTGLDESALAAELSLATDRVLGEVVACDRRAAFPLQLLHARHYIRPRLALIGDAAHAVHPLAGQGVNMGFSDVTNLASSLTREDPGDFAGLRRYERKAKADNLLIMGLLESLHRLFAAEHAVVRRLRSAGLGLVNRTVAVKNLLIRGAGLRPDQQV